MQRQLGYRADGNAWRSSSCRRYYRCYELHTAFGRCTGLGYCKHVVGYERTRRRCVCAFENYVRHTHIKDLRVLDGKDKYMLFGEGETPIFEAIDLLAKEKYNGYFSFEWEKLWHPEIDAPEIAIADYSKKMKAHFAVS